jgi:Xaa-Pro dipeptidase
MSGTERVLDEMARRDIDVLLLGREPNARFVSNASRLYLAGARAFAPGCVVVRGTGAVHVLSVGDTTVPREHLYPITWNPSRLMERIAAMPGVASARRIGVDGMTPLFEALLTAFLPNAELVDGEEPLRRARQIKTPEEIDAVRAAVTVAGTVMAAALHRARAGGRATEIVATAMEAMARAGVTTAAFEPVVHHHGDVVAIDIGVLRNGWEGGLARTAPGREPPAPHREVIARCRPGTVSDALAPAIHGIGLGYEVLAPGTILQPGMVVSVTTRPARDIVLITDGEPDVLTSLPYA